MIDYLHVLLNEPMSLYGIRSRNTEQRNYFQLKKEELKNSLLMKR
jgi:hypothetical protein